MADFKEHPKILCVETGFLPFKDTETGNVIDYHIYQNVPKWWRKIEEALRLDFYLAFQARRIEKDYDIIWARSEKVGIPLSFLGIRKPLVVCAHNMESPVKAKFAQLTGLARHWSGIGYYTEASREFLLNTLGADPDCLFLSGSARYLDLPFDGISYDGPIISLGAAKRDYQTLILALARMPGLKAEIFSSSRFGDKLKKKLRQGIPEWVEIWGFTSEEELIRHYKCSRFAVVPLQKTSMTGTGMSVVLEAGALGKAVIATRTAGMETFVKDGITGILVPANDVEAMQAAIWKLWTQPELARSMGLAARQFIQTNFSNERINSDIQRVMRDIYRISKRDHP